METLVLLSALALWGVFGNVGAQVVDGGGIVYGDRLGVGVVAPDGWVFDDRSGLVQGLHAVMYPRGASWADANEVMYVNVARLGENRELLGFIRDSIRRLRMQAPTLQVTTGDRIETAGGRPAEVRLYTGDSWGNHEAVAYTDDGESVAIYVLSCRTAEGFGQWYPTFRSMVEQSFLVTVVVGEDGRGVE